MGRVKGSHWGDRCIDLDILLYEDVVINTSELSIPHPELLNRSFAFLPTVEIAGEFWHPIKKMKLANIDHVPFWPCWVIGALPIASLHIMR